MGNVSLVKFCRRHKVKITIEIGDCGYDRHIRMERGPYKVVQCLDPDALDTRSMRFYAVLLNTLHYLNYTEIYNNRQFINREPCDLPYVLVKGIMW